MRGRHVAAALSGLLVAASLVGCGDGASEAPPDVAPATSTSPSSPDSSPTATCNARCRFEERVAERCPPLLADIRLTWRITTRPVADGQEIGLRMVLANRSDARLSGDTWGALQVAPGGRAHGIKWGGSSADVIYQKPGTTTNREVWHERRPPGWRPLGEQVTAFRYDAYTYAPGAGATVCHIPARVEAPRGLVVGHPSGRWAEEPSP